ncbi:cobalamin-independent methionine synthase II family protein [Pseudonocardia pini]|uniref:cobalamin-independent methionine synthase II family protein n=1 Tax=Pseudonocardia pini TaxID=2758030 RepID=UPI0015F0B7C2|nr:cobalamin-independent methionine synthase II family protein [Pseudonocardia pini]
MSTTPFRAEVVGSLLRPRHLVTARAARRDGTLAAHEFKRIEDTAVDRAIAVQEGSGLDVVTDGELRRGIFTGPLTENVDGLEYVPGVTRVWYTDEGPIEEELPVVVTGTLRFRRSVATEEFAYARARARRPVKITLPSPLMMFLRWSPEHSTAAYPDAFAMAADAAAIVREEVRELAALGCTYVQIDAPEIATLVQQETRDWYERQGISPERILTEGLDLLDSVTDVPGVTFGVHLCRGNRNGRWMAVGGYDYVAEALFRRCRGFDRFLLEYDDERSGTFEPLAAAPADRTVVLGLVSTKTTRVETVDEIVGRLHEATAHIPAEQLALSTQCGFASMVDAHPDLTEDVQAAKLDLVAEATAAFWKN